MEIGQGITISGGTVISTTKPTFGQIVNMLLVAGGGGGGGLAFGGGGGGGGFISNSIGVNVGTNYSVIVGAGGGVVQTWPGNPSYGYRGDNGANTTFNGITAVGGGGGGNFVPAGNKTAGNHGGSGGGGQSGITYNNGDTLPGGNGYGYPSPTQQGYPGGTGSYGDAGSNSGGGGGAGGAGETRVNQFNTQGGGNGGIGRQWWDGNYYAGGGAGASNFSWPGQNLGGLGGGGNSGAFDNIYSTNNNGANAAINTGGGGGGAAWGNSSVPPGSPTNSIAGQGGSGIAIFSHPINIPTANTTGSPNVTYVSGNIIYKFTQSGTIRWDIVNYLDLV